MVAATKEEIYREVAACIDVGLDLAGISKKTVHWYLYEKCGLTQEAIVNNPSSLTGAIRTLFGHGGDMLEVAIVRELKRSFAVDQSIDT
ncbi:MAG TPA: hypothetical protein VE177_01795, partial [Candidatus Binatus sp.]|nr:hypothetical protein [Candidatus Binatus sp.]